jgi:MoxR-like ATPase
VLATQNPIEQEGTYPLPEAQLDRFMFNVKVDYPSEREELEIVQRTTGGSAKTVDKILSAQDILDIQEAVRRVPVADPVVAYAVKLARATRVLEPEAPDFVKSWVRWGAGPRAAQYLILGAKARALVGGRGYVPTDDVKAVAHPVLRHRVLTNFQAEAEGITTDKVIDRLLESIPAHDRGALAKQGSPKVLGN